MMIRGRHRGLPYGLDRAIMLPDERFSIEDSMPEPSIGIQRRADGEKSNKSFVKSRAEESSEANS